MTVPVGEMGVAELGRMRPWTRGWGLFAVVGGRSWRYEGGLFLLGGEEGGGEGVGD